MSILYFMTFGTIIAAIVERPRKVKVYRKRRQRIFGLDPGAMEA